MSTPKIPRKKSKIKDGKFDPAVFLETTAKGRVVLTYRKGQNIFEQGAEADAIFYIREGKVKVTVVSKHGKEAVVAIMGGERVHRRRVLDWAKEAPGNGERNVGLRGDARG